MPERFSPAQPNYLRFVSTPTIDIEPEKSIRPSAPPTDTGGAFFGLLKKPRRVCAAHGANKVKIIFSGGKWVRLQEHKRSAARLAKSNPCSAYVGENTSRPASWVRLQLCKLCAAQLVKSNPCSAVEFLRFQRRNYARSRVQDPSNASPAKR